MTKQLWTKEEEDRLIMMAAQGKTNRQIADALRRTECAVAHKYAKLGIKKRVPEELKAEEPEDETGDGSTELEREIRFQASVIDTLRATLPPCWSARTSCRMTRRKCATPRTG